MFQLFMNQGRREFLNCSRTKFKLRMKLRCITTPSDKIDLYRLSSTQKIHVALNSIIDISNELFVSFPYSPIYIRLQYLKHLLFTHQIWIAWSSNYSLLGAWHVMKSSLNSNKVLEFKEVSHEYISSGFRNLSAVFPSGHNSQQSKSFSQKTFLFLAPKFNNAIKKLKLDLKFS